MHSTAEDRGEPNTNVGLWFRALLRGDSQVYRRLGPTLNRGEKGWNDDEPAVVEAACELATRQFFSTHTHVSIADFVADTRRRIGAVQSPPLREDMEAIIRAALDSSAGVPNNIKRIELLNIRATVTANIVDILKLETTAIDQLITSAESAAESRGFSPPRAAEA